MIIGSSFLGECIADKALNFGASRVYMVVALDSIKTKYEQNRLSNIKDLGVIILPKDNSNEFTSMSKEMDYLVLADNINHSIDLKLSNHLEKTLRIELVSWVDPISHLLIGQDNVFAGGNMVGNPLSLEESVRCGRKAALSVNNLLKEV